MIEIVEESEIKSCFDGRICCRCGNTKTYIKNTGMPEWRSCKCTKENCAGYLCKKCWSKNYNVLHNIDYVNLRKDISNSRTGNISRYTSHGKGIIGQWVGAKTLGLKDLNIENNNFNEPIDLSYHQLYGRPDVKIKTLKNGEWHISMGTNRIGKQKFDTSIILCMDRYELWKDVEIVYAIPWKIIENRKITSGFTIIKGSSRYLWYEEFRIDERPFNRVYHSVDIPEIFNPWNLWGGKYDRK